MKTRVGPATFRHSKEKLVLTLELNKQRLKFIQPQVSLFTTGAVISSQGSTAHNSTGTRHPLHPVSDAKSY